MTFVLHFSERLKIVCTRLFHKSDIFLEPVEVCFPIVLRIFFEIGSSTKGQLISKYPFGVIVSTKKPTILFKDFCPSF